jgi:hypothetical protein
MTVSRTKERDEEVVMEEGETEIKGTTWTMERKRDKNFFPLFLTGHTLTHYFIQRIPQSVIKNHLPFMFLSMFRPPTSSSSGRYIQRSTDTKTYVKDIQA